MTFFPILTKKKNANLKKKCFFLKIAIFIQSTHTTSYMVTFSFNLMAIVCVIANLFVFLLTKNEIIVHYNKFPKLGVYHTTFPILKGPRAPSRNCKKNP